MGAVNQDNYLGVFVGFDLSLWRCQGAASNSAGTRCVRLRIVA